MATRLKIGNSEQAIRRAREADLARRQLATTILSPETVGKKVSPAKVLMTTIDGQARPIGADDLRRFRDRIAEVGKDARAGITSREALAMSRPIDLKRASDEIKFAVPVLMKGSTLRMATNTGPASRAARHFVEIDFPQFSAAVARPATAQQGAAWLLSETPKAHGASVSAVGQVVTLSTEAPGVMLAFGIWLTHADLHSPEAPDLGPDAIRNPALEALEPNQALLVQVLDAEDAP